MPNQSAELALGLLNGMTMKLPLFALLVVVLGSATGCGTVCKTVGTTLHIAGQVTKTSFQVAKTGVGAAVDVSAHAVRTGVDLADHAARKPVVAKAAASYAGGPAVATVAAVTK